MPAKSIDGVITQLDSIIETSLKDGSALGFFAILYKRVTELVKEGIQKGRFQDGTRMEKLDVIFANRYLAAYQLYTEGNPPTESWKTSFDAAGRNNLLVLQHLFLGMNAHINLDLGIAAAETVPHLELPAIEKDFFEINSILIEQIDAVQDQLSRVNPGLFILDWFGKKSDEHFAGFSLKKARTHAWLVALRLSQLTPGEKEAAIGELDHYVAVLNKLILEPGFLANGLIKFVGFFEKRDVRAVMRALNSP